MGFTISIGESARDFDLLGVDGKRYSLESFRESRILVVVFSCNHCPYVVGSEDRYNRLYADYSPRGLAMVAINSNDAQAYPSDSYENMIARARSKDFRFPYVHDPEQSAALAYGALRTPHFFVFDAQRRLQYTGRMDDNPRQESLARTHELRDALEAMLAGEPVAVPVTNPIGCNIKWKGREAHWMPPEACDLV